MSNPSGLVVPVNVLAYCIGTLDAKTPAQRFSGATTDYSDQTRETKAFLGVNVTRDLEQPPLWPLEAGVHLHWAMPDALTRSSSTSGPMTFPALPTRWLVSRVVGNGVSSKHWIVESDTLSTAEPRGATPPSVPVTDLTAASQRGFRYLGAWQVFDGSWREPRTPAELTLKAISGYDLHAVATGDIAFAALYPNARGVFGFYDDLSDLDGSPAQLMYVVTGWYGTPGSDPLNSGLTRATLEAQFKWTVASTATVTYSLYNGLVQDVAWDPNARYITEVPEPITGDVAIGNHPAEALAAYFRGRDYPTLPVFEELLTLYTAGLLPNLSTPTAGQLAELEEMLHELQFTGVDAGSIYTIAHGTTEAIDLPMPLADALNLLNGLQQEADTMGMAVRQAKWQLFASWYRLFQVDPMQQNAAFTSFSAELSNQSAIAQSAAAAAAAAAAQKTVVQGMLSGEMTLIQAPASRYYAPTEPVVLLAGDAAAPAVRHGGDGRYNPNGFLVCRLDTDVLQALTINAATPVALRAAQFPTLLPPAPNSLPYPAISTLVAEAALLDTAIGAAATGLSEAALAADLLLWLEGGAAKLYGQSVGGAPSPVGLTQWSGANPWFSLLMIWKTDFHPLLATADSGALVDYPTSIFTSNYSVDPSNPRMIAYAPGPDGITIDPAAIDFDSTHPGSGTQLYKGAAVLSSTAADNLRDQLSRYLSKLPDPTLQKIADELADTDISMQGLMGFNDALLTRRRSLQLSIGTSPTAPLPLRQATGQVTSIIQSLSEIPALAPEFSGAFNPLRAGYIKLSLQVVDPFGRRRPVQIQNLYVADSLGAYINGTIEPGIIYAQPRLSQPSRLLFRWLAADSTEYDEMNVHPATTPVCGWILPSHLAVGVFIYDAQGNPLGSLTLRADGSTLEWQSTPGDDGTIDADLPTVMAHQNPHLRDLALGLGASTPAWFRAFWQAIDQAVTQIAPAAPTSQAGLVPLVGRPLALVQASLLLELQGIAAYDQTFATLKDGQYVAADHAIGGVQFPVVIGDLKRIADGLVGYFKHSDGSYATEVFYSEAATGTDSGVVAPSETNVLLAPVSTQASPPPGDVQTKLLMLVDPRAPVHATMGVLPTQSLAIPSEQYEDVLMGLELTVAANPLLRAARGLAVPLPAIPGFNWSWITEQQATEQTSEWVVDPQLTPPSSAAVWEYSPQTLTEGWLRLNPELLQFQVVNSAGQPVVTAGTTTPLTVSITNKRRMPITFEPGTIVDEASPKQGSLFYMHFGALVAAGQVGTIQPAAPGWRFSALTDAQYGTYWAATPAATAVTLAPGAVLAITLTSVPIATGGMAQARLFFDYYNVTGDNDGIDIAVLAVEHPSSAAG